MSYGVLGQAVEITKSYASGNEDPKKIVEVLNTVYAALKKINDEIQEGAPKYRDVDVVAELEKE